MAPNTASLLPVVPRLFFVYVEPIAITYGMAMQYATTHELFSLSSSSAAHGLPVSALVVPSLSASYLFSIMLYGLIILLATPPNKRLLQLHISILVFADFMHWGALFSTMARNDPRGWPGVLDMSSWDPNTSTLITGPIITFAIKIATLAGVFGKIQD
ncbi:hypothetical protein F5Y19DRAFT_472835 [Xylariaceae sp. FL1651]|nr:hypothetical protein F5Y19DRAFT_472835 [Xylariaceae sp. FL1651]